MSTGQVEEQERRRQVRAALDTRRAGEELGSAVMVSEFRQALGAEIADGWMGILGSGATATESLRPAATVLMPVSVTALAAPTRPGGPVQVDTDGPARDISSEVVLREQPVSSRPGDALGGVVAPDAPSPKAPSGPAFILRDTIGQGGMGVVHAARQTSLGRIVALKQLRRDLQRRDPRHQAIFLSEGLVTAYLEHPNIVPLHDLAQDQNGQLFVAMKRVVGQPWSAVIDQRSRSENVEILQKVADAVAFAHDRGILHRDLKPGNIMIGDFGEVLLMDWGLAVTLRDGVPGQRLDASNAKGGTPAYLAPEMAQGDVSRMGPATDVYLLGGLLFRICTGQPPHPGANAAACVLSARDNILSPHDVRHDELLRVALTALATDPHDRPATVKAFQAAVRVCQQHDESLRLAGAAQAALESARQQGAYEGFSRAVWGFQESLERWRGNVAAQTGLAETRQAWARVALERGDLDLAAGQVDGTDPSTSALREDIARARAGRLRQQQQSRWWRRVVVGATAAILIILALGFVLMTRERNRTTRALETAEAAKAQAERSLHETQAADRRTAAVNQFLLDMLASADPYEEGRNVTVLEMAQRGVTKAAQALSVDPEAQVAVLLTLTKVLRRLGHLDEAATCGEQAMTLSQTIHKSGHPVLRQCQVEMAWVRYCQCQYNNAEWLLEQVFRDSYIQEPVFLAEILCQRGQLRSRLNKHDEAIDDCRQACRLYADNGQRASDEWLIASIFLADVLVQSGRPASLKEAEMILTQFASDIASADRRRFGQLAMEVQGRLFTAMGRHREAAGLFQRALENMRRSRGEKNVNVVVYLALSQVGRQVINLLTSYMA